MSAEVAYLRRAAVTFTLNGRAVTVHARADQTLLDLLRDELDLISPKNGCQPMGQCGCCTVLIDGKPRLSCTMKAAAVAGRSVTTLEGLPESARAQIAECFVRAGGVQCGFCIPGIAIRAHAMCQQNVCPSGEQIAHELRAHLCRCTGYTKIIDAIELLARVRRGEPLPDERCTGRVGERLPRYSGREATLGSRRFIDDIKLPGMLFAAPRLSDHPRALLKRIDPAPALAMPGVLCVVTAKDVPGDRHVGLITPDWPVFIAEGEETRYVGDVLAFVVAEEMQTARAAADAIQIDYEVRRPVTSPDEALRPDAPKVHPDGNLLSRSALVRGDPQTAFARSTHVIEHTWQTQCVEHMFLEPEACIAIPEGAEGLRDQGIKGSRDQGIDGVRGSDARGSSVPFAAPKSLRVLTQGQGIFDDRRQIARVLGWPEQRLHLELVSNGGAFGGKEDLSIQAQTALCAMLVGKPVKCVLTREQSMRLHPKRHPVRITLRVGCDADGRLTAIRARMVGDKGAYASVGAKVLERAAGHAIGPYRCDHIDIESLAVYTNNPPNGAMRGFGVNQAAFAVEGALDILAEKLGLDGWEIRWRNILRQGDRFCTGQRLTKPIGLERTLLAVRDVYRGAKYAGIACGIKNVGIGNGLPEIGRASLTVEADGTITLRTGHTEMGQGLFTVAIQAAVEETGLPAELFRAQCDTADPLDSGQTTGSRGTVLTCHAVIDACRKLNVDLVAAGLRPGRHSEERVGAVSDRDAQRYEGMEAGRNDGNGPAPFVGAVSDRDAQRYDGMEARRNDGSGPTPVVGAVSDRDARRYEGMEARRNDGSGPAPFVGAVSDRDGRRYEGMEAQRNEGSGPAPFVGAVSDRDDPSRGISRSETAPTGGDGIRAALRALAGRKYLGEWTCYPTDKFGADVPDPKTHLTYGFATQVCILDDAGRVQKIVAAHDVGRVMNPTLLEGQLEGSLHMGLGYALTEEFVVRDGRLVTDDIKSCGILRAHHMPEIELILIEEPDPECPYGVRGVAEIGLVPTAPAVAGALAKFDGVRRFTLPMKDSPAAQAILAPRRMTRE